MYGIGIGLLILAGAVLISDKLAVDPSQSGESWGTLGSASLLETAYVGSSYDAQPLQENFTIADLYRNLESDPDRFYASLNPEQNKSKTNITGTTTGGGYLEYDSSSIDALLAAMKPSSSVNPTGSDQDLQNVYNFIPASIMGTSTPTDKPLTASQQALFEYGNEAGQPIESYFTLWGQGQAQVFKNFIEDKGDPDKAAAALAIADALYEVGDSLSRMEVVPAQMASHHAKLAASYQMIGEDLALVAKADNDDSLLAAIETYNASVEQFARNYLAVVTVFSANGVTFDSDRPGRVFVFTPIQMGGGF